MIIQGNFIGSGLVAAFNKANAKVILDQKMIVQTPYGKVRWIDLFKMQYKKDLQARDIARANLQRARGLHTNVR